MHRLTPPQIAETRAAMERHGRNANAIARELGIARSTAQNRLRRIEEEFQQSEREPRPSVEPAVHFPFIPDADEPIEVILDRMTEQAERQIAAEEARDWQTIEIGTDRPIVMAFVGDPHLGPHCHMPMLRRDVALLNRPFVYACNIGDTTDNWTGKLLRKYADVDMGRPTERRLIKWFLHDAKIRWLVWLFGNHDAWEHGSEFMRVMNTRGIVMEDWGARFKLKFATGIEVPIWAAHDFPGQSQWNKLHANIKTAVMRGGAAIYVSGHRHTWGVHCEEIEDTGNIFWALRAKGYKFGDEYARRKGYGKLIYGATVAAVINPKASCVAEAITCFHDLEAAVKHRDAIDA